MTDLRARQRASTREQILDAVQDLLTEESPATLSMPRVADRAGISLRTLYRYFPTKEALVDAASESFRVSAEAVGGTISLATLGDYMAQQWAGFADSHGAIRAQHMTPAGRALRDVRLPRNRAAVRAAIDLEGGDLDDDDRARLADLIVATTSSSMFLELVDRMGVPPDEAGRLVGWAIQAVVERARAEGGVNP